ncbi:hypothetical protein INTERNEXUS_53 [Bacillus phage vB_BspM_Internexus]|nr:hypothetical protein INTERNEXUS_53 [Bacillus phage vB_BspM_Internexus]
MSKVLGLGLGDIVNLASERDGVKYKLIESTKGDKCYALLRSDVETIFFYYDGNHKGTHPIMAEDKNGIDLTSDEYMPFLIFADELYDGRILTEEHTGLNRIITKKGFLSDSEKVHWKSKMHYFDVN